MKRVAANDPAALFQMGVKICGEGDHDGAFKYYTKAAALGNISAHFNLSLMYRNGQCIKKDKKKEIYKFHLEEAAIGGHPIARNNLACQEEEDGRLDRAVKHWVIAANLGNDVSLRSLRKFIKKGLVGKEEYTSALCGYQTAVDATKSHQRELAESFKAMCEEKSSQSE